MSTKDDVLFVLENNRGRYISGEELAVAAGISRNSVWKAISALRDRGYSISAVQNRGYCLSGDDDIISTQSIARYMDAGDFFELTVMDEVTSTNALVKQLAEQGKPEGTAVIANSQTQGRGRKGRSFFSPADSGIYMSVLLRPHMAAADALLITTAAAVAVAQSVEEVTHRSAVIKWVNDIFCDGRKVCGILTEASVDFETGGLSYAVLGIGINIAHPRQGFPSELNGIADSLFEQEAPAGMRSRIAGKVLQRFLKIYRTLPDKTFMDEYIRRSFVIGMKVDVIAPSGTRSAQVLGIDADAALLVRYDNGEQGRLASGEISIKEKKNE
ncbi:MAG: biotin--[acetyl-CoA-carboxylase] ligase [Clostridia bacterium]